MQADRLEDDERFDLERQESAEDDVLETKRRHIDILILGGLAIPPLFASTLYYPASTRLAEDVGIHDEFSLMLIGVSCLIAELALYEVKTMKFGKKLSGLIKHLYDLEGAAEWRDYFARHVLDCIKHALLMAISFESSYMYKYVSEDLTGSQFLAWMTFFAKYTTFHISLDELVEHIDEEVNHPTRSTLSKAASISMVMVLGLLGATYVYGKAEEAFESLGVNSGGSVFLGIVAMLPTAFLTGTSLVNLARSIECDSDTVSAKSVGLLALRELFYIWLAITSAAPNGYFLESWGSDHDLPAVPVWFFTVLAGVLSGITKRDSLPKVVRFLGEKGSALGNKIKPKLPCFASSRFFKAEDDGDAGTALINPAVRHPSYSQ